MGRKSREKKLRALLRRSGAVPVIVTRPPPGMRKMSEILLDIAAPLLDAPDLPDDPDAKAVEATLNLAAALWNARALLSDVERRAAIADLTKTGRGLYSSGVEALLDEVLVRARTRYPHETRKIAAVRVSPGPKGKYNIHVTSTLQIGAS